MIGILFIEKQISSRTVGSLEIGSFEGNIFTGFVLGNIMYQENNDGSIKMSLTNPDLGFESSHIRASIIIP